MSIQTYILESSGSLTEFKTIIKDSLECGIEKINSVLSLSNIDVVVEDNPRSTIQQIGVGGFAPTKNLVHICIDPKFKNLNKTLYTEMVSTLAHKFNHCVRETALGNSRKNLLEALITDGLADHFDMEITGGEPRPWNVVRGGENLQKLLKKAEVEFLNEKYNHQIWFFGSDDGVIPKWTGYTHGYYLVGEYMKKNNKKASELCAQEAREFLR